MSQFHRIAHDSAGHKAEIILFSEFQHAQGFNAPAPEDIVSAIYSRTPGMEEGAEINRYPSDERRKYKELLRWAMSILTERQRNMIYLKFYRKLRNVEIARQLGVSRVDVLKVLNNATENLRKIILSAEVNELANSKEAEHLKRWETFKKEVSKMDGLPKRVRSKLILLAERTSRGLICE